MKKWFLSAAIPLLSIATYGQEKTNERAGGKITGRIIDSSSKLPLEYATITLYVHGKDKPVNGTTSDSAGNFTLSAVPSGTTLIITRMFMRFV